MLEEKVAEFIDNLFCGWIDLACDDCDEMENYDIDPETGDGPKEYARCRMHEVADDLDYWFDNEFEWYDNGEFIGYDIQDVKAEFKKQLDKLGY